MPATLPDGSSRPQGALSRGRALERQLPNLLSFGQDDDLGRLQLPVDRLALHDHDIALRNVRGTVGGGVDLRRVRDDVGAVAARALQRDLHRVVGDRGHGADRTDVLDVVLHALLLDLPADREAQDPADGQRRDHTEHDGCGTHASLRCGRVVGARRRRGARSRAASPGCRGRILRCAHNVRVPRRSVPFRLFAGTRADIVAGPAPRHQAGPKCDPDSTISHDDRAASIRPAFRPDAITLGPEPGSARDRAASAARRPRRTPAGRPAIADARAEAEEADR